MSRLPGELHEFVSYELFQSVMEIKTPPCASTSEVEKHLRELRSRVGSWAAACGASLASAGTHPFSRYRDQKVTDQERYKNVLRRRSSPTTVSRSRRRSFWVSRPTLLSGRDSTQASSRQG